MSCAPQAHQGSAAPAARTRCRMTVRSNCLLGSHKASMLPLIPPVLNDWLLVSVCTVRTIRGRALLHHHLHAQPARIDRWRHGEDQRLTCDETLGCPKRCECVEEIVVAVLTARQARLGGGVRGPVQRLDQRFPFGSAGG